jgi:hypothetical protein
MTDIERLLSSIQRSKSIQSKSVFSKQKANDINEVIRFARELNFAVEAESTNGSISSLRAELKDNHFNILINYKIKSNKPLVDLNITAKNLTVQEIEDFSIIVKDATKLVKKLRNIKPSVIF